MKTASEVDQIMDTIPRPWRFRWCESKACACLGCVQIGNRILLAQQLTGRTFRGDPEYIDITRIPEDLKAQHLLTREEWEDWKTRHEHLLHR